MLGLCHTLSHTLSHAVHPYSAVHSYSENRHFEPARARASIASHTQSPSKAPRRPAKAAKSPRLGQRIARQLCRLVGPLNRPHQNGANGPLDSMVSRVVFAQARPHAPHPRQRARSAGAAGAYGGVGVRWIGLGASHTRYKFSFYFWLGSGLAIRLASHSRRASLSALQDARACFSPR